MREINSLMGWISGYKIMGTLPLDLTLHLLIGGMITIFMLKKGAPFFLSAIVLIFIAGLKEFYDYFFHYRIGWREYAEDFSITLFYLALIGIVRFIKKDRSQGLADLSSKAKKKSNISKDFPR